MIDAGKEVSAIAFSPDGNDLMALVNFKAVKWQNWKTNAAQAQQILPDTFVRAFAFSDDGKYLATTDTETGGVGNRTVAKVWKDWKTSKPVQMAQMAHDDFINSVEFSRDGKQLVTASNDKSARIWDIASSKEIARMPHNEVVNHAQLSADGRYLSTTSSGAGQVRTDILEEACKRLARPLLLDEWRQYLEQEPYIDTCKAISKKPASSNTPSPKTGRLVNPARRASNDR